MAVSVLSAAKRLAKKSRWSLSNLELQKILYLAHMIHLGQTGEPLVKGYFEAWNYGPVHPVLYHHAKVFGADPVKNIFHGNEDLEDDDRHSKSIDAIYHALENFRPGQLVALTHRKNGAWERVYIPGKSHCRIKNEDILSEYNDRQHHG